MACKRQQNDLANESIGTVHVANHGLEALDFLSKTNFWYDSNLHRPGIELSVILMDLEMPIMDGLTCTRRIRDLEREGKVNTWIPILAVTANTRMEQMDLAIEAGMVWIDRTIVV